MGSEKIFLYLPFFGRWRMTKRGLICFQQEAANVEEGGRLMAGGWEL
jgi:hypothetical protein